MSSSSSSRDRRRGLPNLPPLPPKVTIAPTSAPTTVAIDPDMKKIIENGLSGKSVTPTEIKAAQADQAGLLKALSHQVNSAPETKSLYDSATSYVRRQDMLKDIEKSSVWSLFTADSKAIIHTTIKDDYYFFDSTHRQRLIAAYDADMKKVEASIESATQEEVDQTLLMVAAGIEKNTALYGEEIDFKDPDKAKDVDKRDYLIDYLMKKGANPLYQNDLVALPHEIREAMLRRYKLKNVNKRRGQSNRPTFSAYQEGFEFEKEAFEETNFLGANLLEHGMLVRADLFNSRAAESTIIDVTDRRKRLTSTRETGDRRTALHYFIRYAPIDIIYRVLKKHSKSEDGFENLLEQIRDDETQKSPFCIYAQKRKIEACLSMGQMADARYANAVQQNFKGDAYRAQQAQNQVTQGLIKNAHLIVSRRNRNLSPAEQLYLRYLIRALCSLTPHERCSFGFLHQAASSLPVVPRPADDAPVASQPASSVVAAAAASPKPPVTATAAGRKEGEGEADSNQPGAPPTKDKDHKSATVVAAPAVASAVNTAVFAAPKQTTNELVLPPSFATRPADTKKQYVNLTLTSEGEDWNTREWVEEKAPEYGTTQFADKSSPKKLTSEPTPVDHSYAVYNPRSGVATVVLHGRSREDRADDDLIDEKGCLELASLSGDLLDQAVEEIFKRSAKKLDEKLNDPSLNKKPAKIWYGEAGSCFTGTLLVNNGIYNANAGDARALIGSMDEKTGEVTITQLTAAIHNCHHLINTATRTLLEEKEYKRIQDKLYGNRLAGVLAVSRAFGDQDCRNERSGVLPEVDVGKFHNATATPLLVFNFSDGIDVLNYTALAKYCTEFFKQKNIKKFENIEGIVLRELGQFILEKTKTIWREKTSYRRDDLSVTLTIQDPRKPKIVFMGVYDGHGGKEVADFIKEHYARTYLPKAIVEVVKEFQLKHRPADKKQAAQDHKTSESSAASTAVTAAAATPSSSAKNVHRLHASSTTDSKKVELTAQAISAITQLQTLLEETLSKKEEALAILTTLVLQHMKKPLEEKNANFTKFEIPATKQDEVIKQLKVIAKPISNATQQQLEAAFIAFIASISPPPKGSAPKKLNRSK